MSVHPRAKSDGLVVRELPGELLLYDLEHHKAHCLNATSAAVWRQCDGETAPNEIRIRLARESGADVDDDVISLALTQLSERKLLEDPVVASEPALTRKSLIRRGALVAGVVTLPAIVSLAAPSVAQAVTCFCGAGCTSSTQCCANCPTCTSNNCV